MTRQTNTAPTPAWGPAAACTIKPERHGHTHTPSRSSARLLSNGDRQPPCTRQAQRITNFAWIRRGLAAVSQTGSCGHASLPGLPSQRLRHGGDRSAPHQETAQPPGVAARTIKRFGVVPCLPQQPDGPGRVTSGQGMGASRSKRAKPSNRPKADFSRLRNWKIHTSGEHRYAG